jgi:drug/metabolite transporter superfamily protein YnfA
MKRPNWQAADFLYAGFLLGSLPLGLGATGYRLVMAGFAVTIGLVDWLECRQREQSARLLGSTAVVLAVLLCALAVPEQRLGTYFAVLGGAFFLQAVRHVLVFEPNPVRVFRRGYPSLVGLSIVCSALADGLVQFRWVLVGFLGAAFLFRKLYVRW